MINAVRREAGGDGTRERESVCVGGRAASKAFLRVLRMTSVSR